MSGLRFSTALAALVSLAVITAACGSESAAPASGAADGTSLQICDPNAPWLEADPGFYRDEPVYVGNEQPTEEIRAWAAGQPAFEELWIDRSHNGWISVGFSEDAAARQRDLEAEFPDVGVVAVEVTATGDELLALRGEVEEALEGLSSWGVSPSVPRGMVEVNVPVLDDETLARLAPLAGPTLCVSGADPADAVPDGPQPESGDGWRLLGTDRTGEAYRTGVATEPDQYAELWQRAGLGGEGPAVDFDTEIVVWFGAVYGSSCPIRLDDVVVDLGRRVVHGDFVLPGNPTACTDDANAEAYVVAVERDRLPAAPFDIQLDADDPPLGAPEERTAVEVDLRPIGSTATADQLVVADPNEPPAAPVLEPDLVIEVGYDWEVRLDLECSVDVLGPINGIVWRAVEGSDATLDAWREAATDGLLEARLLLDLDPPQLAVLADGGEVLYDPVPARESVTMTCR